MKVSLCSGFTLLELLVVIGITGILASIAIPQFAGYRSRSFDARAQLDLRHVSTAEEAYFVDNAAYKTCNQSNCAALLPGLLALSPGVVLQISSTSTGFTGTASHPQGTGQVFTWSQ